MENITCQQNCNLTGCITCHISYFPLHPAILKKLTENIKNKTKPQTKQTNPKTIKPPNQNKQTKSFKKKKLLHFFWIETLGENLCLTSLIFLEILNSVLYYKIGTV